MPLVTAPDGLRLAYDATDGPGLVLLLLHGFGDDRRLWHAAGVVTALTADFRVVTLDLRGCGAAGRATRRTTRRPTPSRRTSRTSRRRRRGTVRITVPPLWLIVVKIQVPSCADLVRGLTRTFAA